MPCLSTSTIWKDLWLIRRSNLEGAHTRTHINSWAAEPKTNWLISVWLLCVCVCLVRAPKLQGQAWRQQPVSDPANLCWVGPNQLNHGDVSQVQAALSVLFTHTHTHKMQRLIYNFCCFGAEGYWFSCRKENRAQFNCRVQNCLTKVSSESTRDKKIRAIFPILTDFSHFHSCVCPLFCNKMYVEYIRM